MPKSMSKKEHCKILGWKAMLVPASSPNIHKTVIYQCTWGRKKIIDKETRLKNQSNKFYAGSMGVSWFATSLPEGWRGSLPCCSCCGAENPYVFRCARVPVVQCMARRKSTEQLSAPTLLTITFTDFKGHFAWVDFDPQRYVWTLVWKALAHVSSSVKYIGITCSKGSQNASENFNLKLEKKISAAAAKI